MSTQTELIIAAPPTTSPPELPLMLSARRPEPPGGAWGGAWSEWGCCSMRQPRRGPPPLPSAKSGGGGGGAFNTPLLDALLADAWARTLAQRDAMVPQFSRPTQSHRGAHDERRRGPPHERPGGVADASESASRGPPPKLRPFRR